MLKKVVILISHIPNPRILRRAKSLQNHFEIVLIYWDRGQAIKESFEIGPKIKVLRLFKKAPIGKPIARILPLSKFMVCAIKALKDEEPNIIHAGNLDMLFIASIYKSFFDKKIRIVYEVADLPRYAFVKKVNSLKTLAARLLQRVERKLTSSISKLILTSPYFWEEYFSEFVDRDKYLFIPNAPYRSLFSEYKKRQHRDFTIGFIGSVRYFNQLKMLIDAVEELDKKNIKIFIAGSGPGYKDILEYSKGKNYVEVYGPYNYEKEIVDLYERVDCVYSVYDTSFNNVKIALPNRLYEAIICEIPIIAARGTFLGEFIEKNQIGVTVDDKDKEELKKVIASMINSKELLIFYQENCNKIKSNYYYEENSEKLLNEYKSLYY